MEIFFPKGFFNKMGRLVAALSIFALVNDSFNLGLTKIFHMCIAYYDGLVKLALSWTEPYILILTSYLSRLVGVRISVAKSWHHVFIIMWILLFRDATVAYSDGRKKIGIARLINGLGIAIIFSFLSSVKIGISSPILQNAQLSILPYIGIYVYDLIMYAHSAITLNQYHGKNKFRKSKLSRWKHFNSKAPRAHFRFVLILAVVALCFVIPIFREMPFPNGGLIILGIATLANLLYWFIRGVRFAVDSHTRRDQFNPMSWYSKFIESEAGRFAFAVGSVFIWLLTFTVLNIGAKLLGL